MQLDILPLENKTKVDRKLLVALGAALKRAGHAVVLLKPAKLPATAFNPSREQFDAVRILNKINKAGVLAITAEDLYEGGLNFVFGLADREGSAIVSYARLRPEFYGERPNARKLLQRLIKESLHEAGHTLGLKHCKHTVRGKPCVMSFSSCVRDVDDKSAYFCASCKRMLE